MLVPILAWSLFKNDDVRGADYLKIDVQGAEVDVFNGAKNLLADIVIVHTEAEFVRLYINQPLSRILWSDTNRQQD